VGTTDRHRWLVLAICCSSLFVVGLDNTIVNVALPTIHTDLGASVSQLQWVVDGYAAALGDLEAPAAPLSRPVPAAS
jgi:MFS family permease